MDIEMDIHKEFTEWAVARGVKLDGIATHRFPGKGLGIIAERELKGLPRIPFARLPQVCEDRTRDNLQPRV
jgi:hypothetical protein